METRRIGSRTLNNGYNAVKKKGDELREPDVPRCTVTVYEDVASCDCRRGRCTPRSGHLLPVVLSRKISHSHWKWDILSHRSDQYDLKFLSNFLRQVGREQSTEMKIPVPKVPI